MRTDYNKPLGKTSFNNAAKRIQAKVLTKSDISALTKLFNSARFGGDRDSRRNQDIKQLLASFDLRIDSGDFFEITQEQSDFGIDWLKRFMFTSKGKLRQGKCVGDFDESEAAVINNFSHFKFIGLKEHYNNYTGQVMCYTPIYRTYSKNGNYFDYAPAMWSVPELVNYNYSN